jgi:putative addiction module killer protein
VFEVRKTDGFDKWLSSLAEQQAVAKIASRIERLGLGNAGDVKPVGEGISEMRLTYGPGYRIYYKQTGQTIVLIFVGRRQIESGKRHQAGKRNSGAAAKGKDDGQSLNV